MKTSRRTALGIVAGFLATVGTTMAYAAETTVTVSLWDRGGDSVMLDDMHMFGMGKHMMMGADMGMAMMGITLDAAEVPAGLVTFNVTNNSSDIIHEMVVSPITSQGQDMPYLDDLYKIDEDAAGHLGEVAELDPGQSGSLGIDLTPGLYLLYCNIPGHYIGGMWTVLTVTP